MLANIRLKNFRCFKDHEIPLRPTTIIVGRNNVGKSTIVEALRLLSLVVSRYRFTNFSEVPDWVDDAVNRRGMYPSLRHIEFNVKSIFHQYGDPPASLTGVFDSGETVNIHIGEGGKLFGLLKDSKGKPIESKAQALKANIPSVSILPQVAPLALEEDILSSEYVRHSLSSYLAPLHFRNQLYLLGQYFNEFKKLAEMSWPSLKIEELQTSGRLPGDVITLLVRDRKFVAEVGWMGHGLQMWLQIMWFLARSKDDCTIILDEPDVYMHADLQRKLIRLIKGRHRQVIIATHSVEIMSEVEPEEILVVERTKKKSYFTTSLPAAQKVVDMIGGVHNLHLSRLWHARRCLLVEGKDMRLLQVLQNILFPKSKYPLGTLPHMSIGGWNGWDYAIGSSMLLKNAFDEEIIPYCLLDSDYHSPAEIKARKEQARKRSVQLHIWKRKEIENYFLHAEAIQRTIADTVEAKRVTPTTKEIKERLNQTADKLKDQTYDAIATDFHTADRKGGITTANRKARKLINQMWKSESGRLSIVSGKKLLSMLSSWSQKKCGVSLTAVKIGRNMNQEEIPQEIVDVLTLIERGKKFVEQS